MIFSLSGIWKWTLVWQQSARDLANDHADDRNCHILDIVGKSVHNYYVSQTICWKTSSSLSVWWQYILLPEKSKPISLVILGMEQYVTTQQGSQTFCRWRLSANKTRNKFKVKKPSGPTHVFDQSEKGLFYFNSNRTTGKCLHRHCWQHEVYVHQQGLLSGHAS